MSENLYQYTIPAGGHWSLKVRRGISLRLTDLEGDGNCGVIFFNPDNLLERYNAPDTLKCQHTFKLTQGHCLYSDMGRIFCSITKDTLGWHESVSGNSNSAIVSQRWGARNYQDQRNEWYQNGHDSFLVELAKYGLSVRDLPANLNVFSKVSVDGSGGISRTKGFSKSGSCVELRFEMDTLVMLHACPHPLDMSTEYPRKPIQIELLKSEPFDLETDECANSCEENRRGFENNRLYHLGL